MAMAVAVQEGSSVDYTPGVAVSAGDVIVQTGLVGVSPVAIGLGVKGSLQIEGVYDFTKKVAATEGQPVGSNWYWDVINHYATKTAGGNALIGKSVGGPVDGSGDNDVTVRVKLFQ